MSVAQFRALIDKWDSGKVDTETISEDEALEDQDKNCGRWILWEIVVFFIGWSSTFVIIWFGLAGIQWKKKKSKIKERIFFGNFFSSEIDCKVSCELVLLLRKHVHFQQRKNLLKKSIATSINCSKQN